MDDLTTQKLQQLDAKLDAVLVSVEKTRRYFRISMWVTIAFLVLPLIATVFVVPMFLNSYLGSFDDASVASSGTNQSQLDQLKDLLK